MLRIGIDDVTTVQLSFDDIPTVDPIAELAARLGVTIYPSLGPEGGRVPCWPGEEPSEMIGMLDEELEEWLSCELAVLRAAA